MAAPNFRNRTLFHGDNLPFLRGMNSRSVHLIATDPPFNKGRDFHATPDSLAAGAKFQDRWSWDKDVEGEWVDRILDDWPSVHAVIETAKVANGEDMAAFLCFMGVRLIEMRRILTDDGSIYVHMDDTAAAWVKCLMDAIFGKGNCRNHLIWRRSTGHNDAKRFGRNVDHILYYVKGRSWTWNGQDIATPKSDDEIAKAYPQKDGLGPVRCSDLTGPSPSAGESGRPWHGYDVAARNRHWAPPKTGLYAEYIERHFIPGYRSIEGVHARLDALDAAGLIRHPTNGIWPGLKRYAAADRGNPPQSLILEPIGFTNFNKGSEWTGYPTQKPLALYERLVKASSNEGDIVLDPFCGCATTPVAAERLGRQWVGMDIWKGAYNQTVQRMTDNRQLLIDIPPEVYFTSTPPFARMRGKRPLPSSRSRSDTPSQGGQ